MKDGKSKKPKIIAMIPARMGSKRLAMKNLALLGDKPLIYYSIKAAKEAKVFDRIVVNSDNAVFSKIAKRYGGEFYLRPPGLATSAAKSDSVVHDFIKKFPCDIITWVNPISPLQTGKDVKDVVSFFIKKKFDSLITVKNEQVHCLYRNKPVNFNRSELFARTQDLYPVQCFIYTVMMWRTKIFAKTFEKKNHAFFCGKTGFYPLGKLSSLIIKTKDDLMLADHVLRSISRAKNFNIKYDSVLNGLKK